MKTNEKLDLELLCLLPGGGVPIPFSTVVSDLGCINQATVKDRIKVLNNKGYKIRTGNGKDGHEMWVPAMYFDEVFKVAETYWQNRQEP